MSLTRSLTRSTSTDTTVPSSISEASKLMVCGRTQGREKKNESIYVCTRVNTRETILVYTGNDSGLHRKRTWSTSLICPCFFLHVTRKEIRKHKKKRNLGTCEDRNLASRKKVNISTYVRSKSSHKRCSVYSSFVRSAVPFRQLTSTIRSSTVCSRLAPMFSTVLFTYAPTRAISRIASSVNCRSTWSTPQAGRRGGECRETTDGAGR